MKNQQQHGLIAALILSAFLGYPDAQAQAGRGDPTVPTAEMTDTLRVQLADFRAIVIHALVVGTDGAGVAILRTGKGLPLASASAVNAKSETPTVRAGTAMVMDASGIPVRLLIKRVTADGVEIEAPTLTEQLFIPGSFKSIPSPATAPPGFLRYLECKDLPLETILRLIADQTGANLAASAEAAQESISIFLRNIPADVAVEEICRTRNLWFRKDETSGIIRVTTMKEYETNLSSFREESIANFTLLYPNVFEVASVIYGLYPERVMLSLGEEEVLENETRDITRRFERLNVISSSSSSGLLNNFSSGGSGGGGGYGGGYSAGGYGGGYGGGGSSSMGNSLLLRNRDGQSNVDLRNRESFGKLTPNNAKELETIMKQGDTNTTQRLLDAYREKNADIFVTASRRNNLLVVRTGDPQVMRDIRELITRLDVPTPMVLLEVRVLQLSLNKGLTTSFEYEFTASATHGAELATGFPGFAPLAAAARSDSMSFQVVSDKLKVRIQMLEKEGLVTTLATPTLLTANSEVSRLFIGEERPMVRNISSQTVVNDQNVVTTPQTETELQPVGTMLLITPNINADRTVTLRLLQENSKILKDDSSIPVATSGGIVQNVPIDVVSSRSISGTFVAKDEMTIAVGGLIEESDVDQESRIPILGSLPYLGWLFRSTERVKSRSELIILVKPHVISTPSEGEAISQRLLKELSAHPAADGRPSLNIYKGASASEKKPEAKSATLK